MVDTGDAIRYRISELVLQLASDLDDHKLARSRLVYRTFREYVDRLDARRMEVEEADHRLRPGNWESSASSGGPSLHELQLDLVDKTEAYHERAYAVLASFVMLLNHIAPASFRSQMPIGSIKKFLDFLKHRDNNSVFHEHLTQLDRSVLFRGRFVMHPQQHAVHDWMTYSTPTVAAVIYFVPAFGVPEGEYRQRLEQRAAEREGDINLLDPYDPSFELSVAHESFYVAPEVAKVHNALRQVVLHTLRLLQERKRPSQEPESSK